MPLIYQLYTLVRKGPIFLFQVLHLNSLSENQAFVFIDLWIGIDHAAAKPSQAYKKSA